MKRFLAKHFPTLARLEWPDWIMLFLTLAMFQSITWGILQPMLVNKYDCEPMGVCY